MQTKTQPIPMHEWGKDHWELLIYFGHCSTERDGRVSRNKMRTGTHNPLCGDATTHFADRPTRLKNGTIDRYDDWDCAHDLIAAGMCDWATGYKPQSYDEPRICMNDTGTNTINALLAHMKAGNHSSTFALAPSELDAKTQRASAELAKILPAQTFADGKATCIVKSEGKEYRATVQIEPV